MQIDIAFSSVWPASREEELSRLMFFNLNQQQVAGGIINSIDLYGLPELLRDGDSLRFSVAGLSEVQTLYAIASIAEENQEVLAGVMIYARISESRLTLLHFGVHEAFSSSGPYADQLLAMKLIGRLRKLARSIRGVKTVELGGAARVRLDLTGVLDFYLN